MILQEITALVILQNPPYFAIQCRWAPQSGLAKVSVQVLINNNTREMASHTESLWFLSPNVRGQRISTREKQGKCLMNLAFFLLLEHYKHIAYSSDLHITIWWFIDCDSFADFRFVPTSFLMEAVHLSSC